MTYPVGPRRCVWGVRPYSLQVRVSVPFSLRVFFRLDLAHVVDFHPDELFGLLRLRDDLEPHDVEPNLLGLPRALRTFFHNFYLGLAQLRKILNPKIMYNV